MNKIVKTGWNLSNFSLQNTTALAQSIGNILLIAASIGVIIMGLPATLAAAGVPDFVMPHFLLVVAKICITAGVIGKIFTKGFGTNVVNEDGSKIPLAPIGSAVVTPNEGVKIVPEALQGTIPQK